MRPSAIPLWFGARHFGRMGHSRARSREDDVDNVDLYDYAEPYRRRRGRPVKTDLSDWRVLDDWPDPVPVAAVEVDVFEAWFGDILDALFTPP